MNVTTSLSRAVLPVSMFIIVAMAHFVWLGVSGGDDCAGQCVGEGGTEECYSPASWLQRYLDGQAYWLGYSYSLSLSFAANAFRRYREQRACAARNVAIGGVTISGLLAVAGCYLLGCCGSPMLPIYLSLFGTAFLPLAKPLVAIITTLTVLAGWWWMNRSRQFEVTSSGGVSAPKDAPCRCD